METEFQKKRRERAEAKARGLRRAADAQFDSARESLRHIPPGQPVLVGHHSEAKHRRDLRRHDAKMRKACELSDAAKSAEWAAKSAGRAISSDDPEALVALRAKLAELEEERETSKRINKLWRKGGADALREAGFPDRVVASLERTMELCHWMKTPCDTKNLSANIRRVKGRIEELEREAEREPAEDIEGEGFTIEECPEDNRIRFHFDERPDKETCQKMKRAGFRFSRRHMAWQRHLNANGRAAARRMAEELFGAEFE